jgi:glycosyltransferase involved in cell wall biosynthesis
MRVLYVVHGFPPEERGGTELHTEGVARQVGELGHETYVFAASRRLPPGKTAPLERWEGRRLGVSLRPGWELEVRNAEVRRVFERYLDEVRPDLVHVQHLLFLGVEVLEAAKERGIPVVVGLHDAWFQCPCVHPGPGDRHPLRGRAWGTACFWHHSRPGVLGVASLARRGLLRATVRAHVERAQVLRRALLTADAVLVPSEFMRQSFERFGIPGGRLTVLAHPVARVPVPARGPERPVAFGYLGALAAHKGVDVLCDAFARTEGDSTLTLYGRCEDPALLERLTPFFGERIRHGGEFDHDRIAEVYAGLDVVVIPSRVQESFSLAALEARAFGRPVVASRIGALPELVVDGENGLLVPPGDVEALREALERLGDPREVARLRVEPTGLLRPEEHARRLEELYLRLVPRGASAPAPSRRGGAARVARSGPAPRASADRAGR